MRVNPAERLLRLVGQLAEIGNGRIDARFVHTRDKHIVKSRRVKSLARFDDHIRLALARTEMATLLLIAFRAPVIGIRLVHRRIAFKNYSLLLKQRRRVGDIFREIVEHIGFQIIRGRADRTGRTARICHKVRRRVGKALETNIGICLKRRFRDV